MYLKKLITSLSILVSIIFLQALISFWALKNAEYYSERHQIANQMLTELISLRADKQRLKVWLAEYLLTANRNTLSRTALLQRMHQQLANLEQLTQRDQLFSTDEQDSEYIRQQTQAIALLQTNLNTLGTALRTQEINKLDNDKERWQALIAVFDTFQGTDLFMLLEQAITEQKQRAKQTEHDSLHALKRVQRWMLAASISGLWLAIILGLSLSNTLRKAIQRLLHGTQQLQRDNFAYRIDEQGPTEFAHLARQFNLMSHHIDRFTQQEKQTQQATEQLVQARTKQLEQAVEQLHQAELRQKQLLADISHELRTPATAILGEAEIALRGTAKPEQTYQETLQRIIAASQQLSQRINDLLMLARGEDRLLQVNLTRVSLTDCYQATIAQIKEQLSRYNFKLDDELQIAPSISNQAAWYVFIDQEKFAVVIGIITDNAIQYSKGSKQIALNVLIQEGELSVELTDFGIGLSEQDQAHLFQRHYRGQAARHSRPEGLGIGLCIAKAIMEAQDGSIQLKAHIGGGTTARLSLPLFNVSDDENFNY